MESITKNTPKIVVYTAISGPGRGLHQPSWQAPNISYFCFTDQPKSLFPDGIGWTILPLTPIGHNYTRNAKRYKLFPDIALPQHDISIWVDANIRIVAGYQKLIDLYMNDYDMVVFKHPERQCLYDEAEICLRGLYQNEENFFDKIWSQMERYKKIGFPEKLGLTENNVLLRKPTENINKLMAFWWNEITNGSQRDQLSFMYSYWYLTTKENMNLKIKFLNETPREDTYHKYIWHFS